MDYITIGAIVIILIIITFLLVIFLPSPRCYFEPSDICKELETLKDEVVYNKIKEEFANAKISEAFVIYDANTTGPLDERCYTIPYLYDILRSIPTVKRASIEVLDAQASNIKLNTDAKLANTSIRCLLPLKLSATKKNTLWVDGVNKFLIDGDILVYDNSRVNTLQNKNKKHSTIMLVIDVDRPDWIPIGIAKDD